MKVLVTENQYNSIITESSRKQITSNLQVMKDFTKEVLNKFQEDSGIQFKLLLTWGAAVGGVMMPLNEYISSGKFNLTPFQITSILVATTAILFNENSRLIKKVIKKIEEDGLEKVFSDVLNKGVELRQTFLDFVESLNVTFYTMTNIMSYAFLIPLLPLMWEIANNGGDEKDIKEITLRFISFGATSVSGVFFKTLISKIIQRFR